MSRRLFVMPSPIPPMEKLKLLYLCSSARNPDRCAEPYQVRIVEPLKGREMPTNKTPIAEEHLDIAEDAIETAPCQKEQLEVERHREADDADLAGDPRNDQK